MKAGKSVGARVRRQQKLKVFRTPIGFHDAYVAATSQKAALAAWGSESDLFAAGFAEKINDPDLMREPLANPGEVIKRSRGTMTEHMAALPKTAPSQTTDTGKAKGGQPRTRSKVLPAPKPPLKPRPRPKRTELDQLEKELLTFERLQDAERARLEKRQADLDRDLRTFETTENMKREDIARKIRRARKKYERAVEAWRAH